LTHYSKIGLFRCSWGAYLGNFTGQSYIADEKQNFSINKMPIMATDCEYNNGLNHFSKIGLYRCSWEAYLGKAMGQFWFANEKVNYSINNGDRMGI